MDASHVEDLIGVGDDVAEPRGALETSGQGSIEMPGLGQPPEGVGVRGRRAELEMKTGRGRKIDDDLDRLPQVEDDRIRCVRRRTKVAGIRGQSRRHARQVSIDGGSFFGERLSIETTQRASSASTSS